MSFVKRSDGITYNTGGHYTTRGSLEQVKYGSIDDEPIQKEDWLKEVVASFMSVEDSVMLKDYAQDGWIDSSNEVISRLWGVYENRCSHVKVKEFDDEYFSPGY